MAAAWPEGYLHGDSLFLHSIGKVAPHLTIAIDPDTGAVQFRKSNDNDATWSTPVTIVTLTDIEPFRLAEIPGTADLRAVNGTLSIVYESKNGGKRWAAL